MPNEVQACVGRHTGSTDASGVCWNFWLKKSDMEHCFSFTAKGATSNQINVKPIKPQIKEADQKTKQDAETLFTKGKYEKALPLFLKLAEKYPKDLRMKTKVGDCLLKMGKKNEACMVYRHLAAQYARDGMLIQAISINKLILSINPKDEVIQNELTLLYSRRKETLGKPTLGQMTASPLGRVAPVVRPIQIKEVDHAKDEGVKGDPYFLPDRGENLSATRQIPPVEISLSFEVDVPPTGETDPLDLEAYEIPGKLMDFADAVDLGSMAEVSLPPTPLFSDLNADAFDEVLKVVKRREYFSGDTLCREDEPGDSLFIVSEGEVGVSGRDTRGEIVTLATLSAGDFFGEYGYFTRKKRMATVTAITACVVLELQREDLDRIVQEMPSVKEVLQVFYRRRLLDTLLARSRIFRPLTPQERTVLMDHFEEINVQPGLQIMREGDDGDAMYLIQEGQLQVYTEKDGQRVDLAVLKEGNFFGEFSVLMGAKKTASICTLSAAKLLRLSKSDAQSILGHHAGVKQVLEAIAGERVAETIRVLSSATKGLKEDEEISKSMV